jgi:hypothetical protein
MQTTRTVLMNSQKTGGGEGGDVGDGGGLGGAGGRGGMVTMRMRLFMSSETTRNWW